jgi:hypothetical protein
MKPRNKKSNRDNPRFIRGIFNYCDLWCERCRFTDRCRCYPQMQKCGVVDSARHTLQQPGYWDHLRQNFLADDYGFHRASFGQDIAPYNPEASEESLRHELQLDELVDRHLFLLLRAQAYALFVKRQLNRPNSPKKFEKALGTQISQIPPKCANDASEALEIISYYHAFIYMKLGRAVYSWAEEQLEPAWMEELSRDSEGSAKVALIAIDRSWLAWEALRCHVAEAGKLYLKPLNN